MNDNALNVWTTSFKSFRRVSAINGAKSRAILAPNGRTDLAVPQFCLVAAADREALAAFEDEIIDRLYVLNAERMREEARLGLVKGSKKMGGEKKTNDGQGELF